MRRSTSVSLLLVLVIVLNPLLNSRQAIHLYAQAPPPILDFSKMPVPSTAAESQAQFNERAQRVIDAAACGMDASFLKKVAEHEDASVEGPDSEGLTAIVIGKIFKYYQLLNETPEGGEFEFRANIRFEGSPCNGIDDETLRNRLREQVNRALLAVRITGRPGTTGIPCYLGAGVLGGEALTHGEYDVVLRNLVRILLMRPLNARGTEQDVLDPGTYERLRNERLTLDGGPGLQSYSVTDCGNTEKHTGSPDERADDYTFAENVGDALEETGSALLDALEWFVLHIVAPVLVWVMIGAVVAVGAGAVLVAGVVIASIVLKDPALVFAGCSLIPGLNLLTACRISETENHLLMMETSRYLTNQIFRSDLEAAKHPVPSAFDNGTNGLRRWMLDHFRQFMVQDFVEYNARPYQRYSVNAILNMYDFAEDDTLRRAAGMVLDYLSAKFAVGSNRGRRVMPFRRLTDYVYKTDLYDTVEGADHQIARFMVLAGLTGLMDVGDIDLQKNHPQDWIGLQENRAQVLIYAAVSDYRLPTPILDWAIDKSTPYVQRIHHDGVELYASSTGYLLSAGGVETGFSGQIAFSGRSVDRGAAVPTVLIPTAGVLDRNDFVRFEGGEAHDGNTCVTHGFACGLNPNIPSLYDRCRTDNGNWAFINTAGCTLPGAPDPDGLAGNPGPYLYIAVYSEACSGSNDAFCVSYEESCSESEASRPASFPYCTSQAERFGFLEVVDAPEDAAAAFAGFQAFMDGIKASNPSPIGVDLLSAYRTTDGRLIQFDPGRGQKASDEWAILAVDGVETEFRLDDWDLAEGDVIQADGGLITIRNPRTGDIILDFTDRDLPQTTVPNDIDREQF
jgi:hypothetical protein